MKRRWFVMALVVLMTICAVPVSAEGPVEIEFWDLFGASDGLYLSAMVDEFNASQDQYFIKMTTQSGGDYYIKLKTAIFGGEAPDLCISHDDYVWGLIKENLLTPIEDACTDLGVDILYDNYSEKLNMLRFDEKVYAVPLDGVLRILHINKAICEEAGILDENGKLKLADGLDGWVEMMEAVAATGHQPFVTREKGSHPVYLFNTLYYQFGGTQPWISDDGTTVTIEKDVAIEALKAYRTILSYNLVGVESVDEIFMQGDTAFAYDMSAVANTYYKQFGDDYNAQGAPLWGDVYCTSIYSHTFVLPQSAKRTDEQTKGALEFIKWFGENNMGWAACGHMPAYMPVRESEEFKSSYLHSLYSYCIDFPTVSLSYGAPIAMKGSAEMNDPLYQVGRGEVTAEEGYELIVTNLNKLIADYE